ncbi:CCR4-NOT core DEDD RNase subunit [Neophaeococcomyces mojaviensis]|uniref:CCR4-NOT core DEDD RNase subunit n=1 Tax=Neophaeococcomyces mojaviensis TaxID=3383035 RepID=A0ACC3AK40_9EURO|nr:CCR4-NOT core DEDD RNase subunit [Knufia sp. JES_112]
MPPPRYGQQAMNGPYANQFAHNQLQSHTQSQHLPPPQLGAPATFGQGNSSSASPFAMPNNAAGFDRGLAESALLQNASAQMAYGRGGPVQAHQQFVAAQQTQQDPRIRDVWKGNLKQEMTNLRNLIEQYPYIAMDTEFPGIVARPVGAFTTKADYHYQTLRCNVDLLKMIQLGITLFKPDGSLPGETAPGQKHSYPPALTPVCTWQFNFQFSLEEDMYAQNSTAMLTQAGLDFEKHKVQGIDPFVFGALLIPSGLVLDADIKWISFHSGYDFGYLMKIMLNKELPDNESEFHDLLDRYFPSLFDIKYIVKSVGNRGSVNNNQELTPEANRIIQIITQKSGLQDLANELGIQRVGIQHQAGSDSLLTGQVYFKMKEKIFGGTINEDQYKGQVWGLNGQMPASSNKDMGTTSNINGTPFYGSNGAPSTPQTGNIGLAQTPAASSGLSQQGFGTPGAFGNFQYSGKVMG